MGKHGTKQAVKWKAQPHEDIVEVTGKQGQDRHDDTVCSATVHIQAQQLGVWRWSEHNSSALHAGKAATDDPVVQKQQEVRMVALADARAEPEAVMVKANNTRIASRAVRGTAWAHNAARRADIRVGGSLVAVH